MKVAIMTGLFAKRDMNIDACQLFCDLMNNFIPPLSLGERVRVKVEV
jgi:hypothetical protein